MASVTGGKHHSSLVNPNALQDQFAATNFGSIHDQLLSSGLGESGSAFGLNTEFVASNLGTSDLTGGAHGPLTFAGLGGVTTESVLATQTVQPGGSVSLQFADGSSINIVGTNHIDDSFFQG
ncbi:hypothetical protein [Oryzibacter oryziterrae]|uniref:hypothetical protein n=1 Tax=Oryzibacter oryziterrae TaxID=2766474 RepID=UPI001F35ABD5|nr:hypothetical protein [Oryzibacter oryziterrae]